MQHNFRFGIDNGPNAHRREGVTFNGSIAQFFPYPDDDHCKIQIYGPAGAERGSAIVDKATARKLGAALLGWAMGAREVGQVTGGPEAGYHPGSLADPRD